MEGAIVEWFCSGLGFTLGCIAAIVAIPLVANLLVIALCAVGWLLVVAVMAVVYLCLAAWVAVSGCFKSKEAK